MIDRASGILLHPSSLPSRGGIGDFGPAAYEFIDFLSESRQSLWQILPLAPCGFGNSPYSSISAFAGNPLLVSLERLAEAGWIDRGRVAVLPETVSAIDYDHVRATKLPLLREAARNFLGSAPANARHRYERFCSENAWWLEDYSLFVNLRDRFHELSRELASDCASPASKKIRGASLQQCIHTAIIKPYAFIPSGYKAGVMPSNFCHTLSPTQVQALVAFLASVTHYG